MSMRSAVVVSAREDVSAEAVTKAVTSDAEAADAGITAGTMRNIVNVADSAVVTAPAAKTAAMGRTAGSAAENAAVAIKRQQNASSQVTAKNGNVRSVKRRKNPVSATASPRERDNENSYIFAAKAAVVLLRQIVYS